MLIFVRSSVHLSVRPSGSSLSRALNFHHSGSGFFQVSLRSLLGLSDISHVSFSSLTLLSGTDGA